MGNYPPDAWVLSSNNGHEGWEIDVVDFVVSNIKFIGVSEAVADEYIVSCSIKFAKGFSFHVYDGRIFRGNEGFRWDLFDIAVVFC